MKMEILADIRRTQTFLDELGGELPKVLIPRDPVLGAILALFLGETLDPITLYLSCSEP